MLGRETHGYILAPLVGYEEINDSTNQGDSKATCEEGKKEINVRKGWKQEFHGLVWRAVTVNRKYYYYYCFVFVFDSCGSGGGSKVKVKWSRYRPGVAQRVGRSIALLFHDCDTRREVSGGGGSIFNVGKLLSYCPQKLLHPAPMTFDFKNSVLSHILSTCPPSQYLPFKDHKITISTGSHYSFSPQPHIHVSLPYVTKTMYGTY